LNASSTHVEALKKDVEGMLSQDAIVRRRRLQIENDPSTGMSEQELDEYLQKREFVV